MAKRTLKYLEKWWDNSNIELCEGITTLCVNIQIPEAQLFLEEKLRTTKNRAVQKDLINAINEMKNS